MTDLSQYSDEQLAAIAGDAPLSVRNNNPGNMRGADGNFQQFDTPDAGMQAMQKDLSLKISGQSPAMKAKFGEGYQPTLANVISTWAPNSENDTQGYIANVAKDTGLSPDTVLTPDHLPALQQAMIKQEGGNPALKQFADAGNVKTDAQVDSIDPSSLSDEELQKIAGSDQKPEKPSVTEDVAKSAIYRGVPEGLAASTLGGFALNTVRGVSDLTRWAGGKIYKAIEGKDLPHYTDNPIPTSSDVLQGLSKLATGNGLYEPKTTQGQYANTAMQFGLGGKITGIPLTASIPAAVASEAAGQATKGSEYEPLARIAGAVIGGRAALRSSTPTLTADETKAASQAAYTDAANKGGILAPSFTNSVLDTLNKYKAQPIAGKVLTSEDAALNNALGEYAGLKDTPLTLADYEKLDKSLGAKETSAMDGFKATPNSRLIGKAQDEIRAKLNSLQPTDITGGKEGFDALTKQAIPLYAKSSRLGMVENIVQKAMSTENPATSLKRGFASIVNNPGKFKQFSSDEQAALQKAAKTGVLGGGLKLFGSSLIPAVLGIGEDIGTGGFTGAVGGYAVGKGINAVANKARIGLQKSRANNALNAISSRGVAPTPSALARFGQSQYSPFSGSNIMLKQQPSALQGLANQPQSIKALPSPSRPLISTPSGIRPMNDAELQSANKYNLQDASMGLTPDVLKAQAKMSASNQARIDSLKRSQTWDNLTSLQQQKISDQINKAWENNSSSLDDIISQAKDKAEQLAAAKGEKYSPTPIAYELLKLARKNP